MAKGHRKVPDITEVLALLTGGSCALTSSDKKQEEKPTVVGAARLLKTSEYTIRKIFRAWIDGGLPAVNALCWKKGRKPTLRNNLIFSPNAAWAVHKGTLYAQTGLSMRARALQMQEREKAPVSVNALRKLYRQARITQQQLSHRLGPPQRVKSEEVQLEGLARLKTTMDQVIRAGYVVVQMDEAVFSVNKYNNKHWAPAGSPLLKDIRLHPGHPVAVIAGISYEDGLVHYRCKDSHHCGFTGPEVNSFLHEL